MTGRASRRSSGRLAAVTVTGVLLIVLVSCRGDTEPAPARPADLSPAPPSAAATVADGSLASASPRVAPTDAGSAGITASPSSSAAPPSLSSVALREAVGAASIRRHLEELEAIAADHGGNRAVGTSGYDASVAYVAGRLQAAGYRVERQPFSFSSGGRQVESVNLVAERPGSDGARVVMLGAHLDSVRDRAGINDNGSGSMTLLVLAERLTDFAPTEHTIRFAFWGAEEPGLIGSTAYVRTLSAAERERIVAYLNFDMLGSPNHVRFVYADTGAAPGSEALTSLFVDYFESVGLAWDTFDLTGKSDHAPFSAAGIATGGLFSGGGELKTDAQATAFGGTAGVPADACNAAACDTTANVSDVALEEMADAAAHALAALSRSDGS